MLRKLREERALSQGDLASELGVSKTIIGIWERGEVWPQPKNIRRLALFFGKTPAEIRRILEEDRKPPGIESGPGCTLDVPA